jgi:DNA-binding NtrC family response regulator
MAKIQNIRLLVVDDEPTKREVMVERLTEMGYSVEAYDNAIDAEKAFSKGEYDVVLTDIRMPGVDGISFLKNVKGRKPDQAVIVMTAFGTVETAIEAMKLGAYDYLQRPFSTEEFVLKLDRLMNYRGVIEENLRLRKQFGHGRTETRLVGNSPAMKDILGQIHVLAAVDSSVLIHGESGTGKECVARLIHESSTRSRGRFIAVSCASLPSELIEAELFGYEKGAFTGADRQRAGRFELADGGTLFLDDVDDIPLGLQVKLLRVIQERKFERIGSEITLKVNLRLIAATKKDLACNVRELQNHIERMLVLSEDGQINSDLLPPDVAEPEMGLVTIRTDYIDTVDLPGVLSSVEDHLVQWALSKSNGNLSKAASCLRIPRSSLQYKVSKLSRPKTDENPLS